MCHGMLDFGKESLRKANSSGRARVSTHYANKPQEWQENIRVVLVEGFLGVFTDQESYSMEEFCEQ